MATEDQKVVINLRHAEKFGELIRTDADGKEHSYFPRRRDTHWACEELQVHRAFERREGGDTTPPKVISFVTGKARLLRDYNVSIIGEPTNVTTVVDLQIFPDDSLDLLKIDAEPLPEGELRLPPNPAYGRAWLGFLRGDWEYRLEDSWWLECKAHSDIVRSLVDAIASGALSKAEISIRLRELYTNHPPYVPLLEEEWLYLRPNSRDNTLEHPEDAHGYLEGLRLGMWSVDLKRSPVSESASAPIEAPESDPTPPQPTPPLPVTLASQLVARHIEGLRGTVRWVGGLIVLMLFLLLIR